MMFRLPRIGLLLAAQLAVVPLAVSAAAARQATVPAVQQSLHRVSPHGSHHAPRGSLLRCVALIPPALRHGSRRDAHGRGRAYARAIVRPIDHDRFFAPTRQAVFFSHPGGRCGWHNNDRHG
ncbi:hypothetical protein [Rhizosaccharibacter radicis]|uniref:Secreted protein n=1 Tax=Rhizosaccharibacter radicis TaxID=2782605 RepID=A0ABT1VW67_9PROT|nr:hypothetical protein [Acetobacteraceae bacterium KSS12]